MEKENVTQPIAFLGVRPEPFARYRRVLGVSLPLVVSMATTMILEATDRIFLAHYSLDAIAAATPGGLTAFLFIAFFMGVGGYVNVFVAQYTGAGSAHRVGSALWQGIYFSVFAGAALSALSFTAVPLFDLVGHGEEIRRLEVSYFRMLCMGGGLCVLDATLSCFYSGRGLTRPVMLVHVAGMLLNIPLNYALIYGRWIFPEMGIAGAGLGTVISWGAIALLFTGLIFTRANDRRYGVIGKRRFEAELFRRLLRFGVPGSLQMTMDLFAFTFFVLMVGRIGSVELAVTNIVLTINNLAFMPIMGFSMGTSTLVGQALGRSDPEAALADVRASLHLIYLYILFTALFYLIWPEWTLSLFYARNLPAGELERMSEMGVVLLRFVVFYIFFDAQYMIYTGALRGAGDTRFIMWTVGGLSVLTMILPIHIGVFFLGRGVYFAWGCVTFFIVSLFTAAFIRFHQGRWRSMRVIEPAEKRL
ncbi:MATE family efflux transporter [Desulfococcus sp.]|uniref:MATE family efflux transporter n=1 Tax=Desulfococcus sp. TaxID=2025834 RepID=UPI003593BFBC